HSQRHQSREVDVEPARRVRAEPLDFEPLVDGVLAHGVERTHAIAETQFRSADRSAVDRQAHRLVLDLAGESLAGAASAGGGVLVEAQNGERVDEGRDVSGAPSSYSPRSQGRKRIGSAN